MLASPGGSTGHDGAVPIYLTAEPAGEGVRLQVIGAASHAYDASFLLEVTSGEGNRSNHHGSASLRPGERVVLSSITLGNVRQGGWQARLRVEPRGAPAYELIAPPQKRSR